MPAATLSPFAGFGLGLRPPHYQDFLDGGVPVDFVEVISENFMVKGGRPLNVLAAIRDQYPVAMHGVSMSIGSADGVKLDYLRRLKALADRVQPLWVSDHLCWTGIEGFNSHDLLPLPYTEEAMRIVCANVLLAQDVLERPLLLENPSTYMTFADDEMSEWAFLSEMCRRTGCYLLLDVNNIYRWSELRGDMFHHRGRHGAFAGSRDCRSPARVLAPRRVDPRHRESLKNIVRRLSPCLLADNGQITTSGRAASHRSLRVSFA